MSCGCNKKRCGCRKCDEKRHDRCHDRRRHAEREEPVAGAMEEEIRIGRITVDCTPVVFKTKKRPLNIMCCPQFVSPWEQVCCPPALIDL